ncbi:MAG: D-alanyl-D-alanine carboxypeptidase/D-alanyl-D-alanine-endopeptidase [Gammaproteobacteria bacterium]|nr:D-alanyl-D-alanine carboxypeptidase/D-alanyl-D-alanine-endopeptidase [Gammaproteobacteria bacterium]
MRGALGVIIGCALGWAHAAVLPVPVGRVLDGHGISADDVSIVVQALDSDEPALSHLADEPRNPASVMKLLTTWAALEILGPAYTWTTEVYFDGEFDGATLDGDLVLKGYGDPYLVLEEFWKLLRALRRMGLEEITGDLVIDDSYFAVEEDDPGAFDGQPFRAYNVLPNALLVNFQAVNFQFFVDARSGGIRVATEPSLSNLDVRNRVGIADGPCRGYQAGISLFVVGEDLSAVDLGGAFPRRCGSYALTRSVLRHDTYAYGLFESLWTELGGRFDGTLRKGVVAADRKPAMTWRSPPLGDVIRSINKNSNNVMTRQLLYTLGAEQLGAPGTRAHGVEVVEAFLATKGFDVDPLVIDNGSGLSRRGRVTARLLVDLLRAAAESPFAPEFMSSLSLGGLDGTTRRRFNGRAGTLHVKTGRLDHVSALAGYVRAASGAPVVVTILVNSENAHRGPGQELEEAVVEWAHGAL